MSTQWRVEIKNDEEVKLRSHSSEVSQIITDLLSCGVIGIEVAQIIDFIDQPSIQLQSFEKKSLFKQLHTILFLIKKIQSNGVGNREASQLNILLSTILDNYIFPVHAELFMHSELKVHVDILETAILEMRLHNKSIMRSHTRKLEALHKRSKKVKRG